MGTKRSAHKAVTITAYDQMVEELAQTRASLEAAVKQVNDSESARLRIQEESSKFRTGYNQQHAEVQALTAKLEEQKREINQLKNAESSARSSLEFERGVSIRLGSDFDAQKIELAATKEQLAVAEKELKYKRSDLESTQTELAEAQRTVERLDHYVCLATSRGRFTP